MAKSKKTIISFESSYDLHAFLDYMLVSTVVEKKHIAKRISLPYSAVIPEQKEKFSGAKLVLEIHTYWDGEDHEREPKHTRTSPTKTRH